MNDNTTKMRNPVSDEDVREEIREMLECTNDGKTRQSIENAVIVLENDPRFAEGIVYNELTERIDIVREMPWRRSGTMMDDTDEVHFCYYLEADYGLSVEQKVRNALKVVANKHSMHPIRDYLLSLTWDGQERVRYALHHFLGVGTSDLTYECLKLFMSGAIYRVFDPGCKFDDMLCLVGEQGGGKSSFFQFLAIKDEWFSDDLRKLDDGQILPASYMNFIYANGALIFPKYKSPNDAVAKRYFESVYPDRKVIALDCRTVIEEGGSLHCMSKHESA